MKYIISILFIAQQFATFSQNKVSNSVKKAEVKLLIEYEVGKSPFYLKNDPKYNTVFPHYLFYQKDEIFMYNIERKVNIYNIVSKETRSLSNINLFIEKKYPHNGVTGFWVKGDSIYIGVDCKRIALFSRKNQKIIKEYSNFTSCITNFSVYNDNTIFAFNTDEFFKIERENIVSKYKTDRVLPTVMSMNNNILAVSDAFGPIVSIFTNKSKGESLDYDFGSDDTELILFSALTERNYVFINSEKTGLWLCNRFNKKKELVLFDKAFLKSHRDAPAEDSRDGIRVVSKDDNTYFILIMKNKKIQLYQVLIS